MTLVIGMAYCRDIVNQFKEDDSKSNLCECVGEKINKLKLVLREIHSVV